MLWLQSEQMKMYSFIKQEYIPAGCIPPTCWRNLPAWTAWGGSLSACWDTPPECGPGDTPNPLDVGLETPWVWTWRPLFPLEQGPLNLPPGCGPGDPLGDLQGMLDTICKACWDTTPPLDQR